MNVADDLKAAIIKFGAAFAEEIHRAELLLVVIDKTDSISTPRPEPIEPWRQKGRKPWRQRR